MFTRIDSTLRSARIIKLQRGYLLIRQTVFHIVILSLTWRLVIDQRSCRSFNWTAGKIWAGGRGEKKQKQLFPPSETLNSYPFQLSSLLANSRKAVVLLGRCGCVAASVWLSEPSRDTSRLKLSPGGTHQRRAVLYRRHRNVFAQSKTVTSTPALWVISPETLGAHLCVVLYKNSFFLSLLSLSHWGYLNLEFPLYLCFICAPSGLKFT